MHTRIDKKIGLIAGNRKFPLIFAEAAKNQGYFVVGVGIKGDTSSALKRLVDKLYWIQIGDFSKLACIFKQEGIERVVMAGQVSPARLFSRQVQSNREIRSLLDSMQDRKPATIFSWIADKLEEEGLKLIDSTTFIQEHLPKKGVLTRRQPSLLEWEDIKFGLGLARDIAGLDIGQTVAVKDKAVIAVEGLEGTDNLIRRAGKLARGGITVVKVSRPKQDMRFDIPVVGFATISNLVKARARCLAIEANKTLFIDKEKSLLFADRNRLSVVAV
ncbi:MAG: UDP-2,3-diacylglucosamine diphosphatase LpxI [Candidatus Omnitrophota bacterium]|nr:UDP-2,3-diacylglucosamine diphosphatase LpxI [Candidatus Omnitrophota bacterium]